MADDKTKLVDDLEKAKEEILRKIAEKVKNDSKKGEEFVASHVSHTSQSKHHSVTH